MENIDRCKWNDFAIMRGYSMENEQIVLKISAFEQIEKQTNEKIEKQ